MAAPLDYLRSLADGMYSVLPEEESGLPDFDTNGIIAEIPDSYASGNNEKREANARLIATAPDMYDAVKEAQWLARHIMGKEKRIDWGKTFDVDFARMNEAFMKFDAVIRRAEGI